MMRRGLAYRNDTMGVIVVIDMDDDDDDDHRFFSFLRCVLTKCTHCLLLPPRPDQIMTALPSTTVSLEVSLHTYR